MDPTKGLMSGLGMNVFTLAAMVISFSAFVAVLIWTFTRPRQQIEAQSRLWEDDEDRRSDR